MKRALMVLLASACFLTPQDGQAQSESAVPFLLIGPGARAAGMGEAFVAISDDATATYWNTAGLAFQTQRSIAFMHSNWLPELASDLFFDYATFVQPIKGLGTIGLAVTYLNLGTQTRTDEEGTVLGDFNSNEYAIGASFGTQLSENSGVGIQLKYIRSNLSDIGTAAEKGNGQANAFAFDLGYLHRQLFLDRLSFGVNITNMGPKITYVDAKQADPLPTNLNIGFAYNLIEQEFNSLRLAFEFDKLLVRRFRNDAGEDVSDAWYKAIFSSMFDEDLDVEAKKVITNIGLEYWYSNLIALRTGWHYDDIGRVKYYTFGAGLIYASAKFDFGYIAAGDGHPLSDTMRFSIALGF